MAKSKGRLKKKLPTGTIKRHALPFKEKIHDDGLSELQREFFSAMSIPQMLNVAARHPSVKIEAHILHLTNKIKEGKRIISRRKMDKKGIFEALVESNDPKRSKMIEDAFAADNNGPGVLVGSESIPLIGGPFTKQQYYLDYLKGHLESFFALHNDPFGRAIPRIMRDFTLGRDWSIEAHGADADKAEVLWKAFAKANKLQERMEHVALELSVYGEVMMWRLPFNQVFQGYKNPVGQEPMSGALPRVRLLDPSSVWDIITYPEDIERVLAYQVVAPTQYQTYTKDYKSGISVPALKYIYMQVPADQIRHYRINVVSNEKRGRGDLLPVLNYMKRLRDTVNYAVISMQKAAAWSIDTTIDGDQDDIDNYMDEQNSLGTLPPAGSEFVHTKAVDRKYLANQGSGGGVSGATDSFSWLVSLMAVGTGISTPYFGTHLTSQSSRASAMVVTEPPIKMFEMRRNVYRRILSDCFDDLMSVFGLNATCEVRFPELMEQNSTQKITDLGTAEEMGWIAKSTAAEMAARELAITSYEYDAEKKKMDEEGPPPAQGAAAGQPLTAPALSPDGKITMRSAQTGPTVGGGAPKPPTGGAPKIGGQSQTPFGQDGETGDITNDDRKEQADARG